MIDDLPLRLKNKIQIDNNTKCWNWTSALDSHGYGRFHWQRKAVSSHRLVYELIKGHLPSELDHLCRNTRCCNPDHLEGVTHQENCRRGNQGKSNARWSQPRDCPKGHSMSGDNLYEHYSERLKRLNRQCKICKIENKRRLRAAGAKY